MRFACPSTSAVTITESSTSTKAKSSKQHDLDRKSRSSIRPLQRQTRISDAKEAMKREVRQQRAKPKSFILNYVFVGNLLPSINESHIRKHFRHCGQIVHVSIRCSRGRPINAALPGSEKDRHYASVEFTSTRSAKKALILDRTHLEGCKIVVSSSAADLPEVKDMVQERLKKLKEPASKQADAPKPLEAHDTERFIDYRTSDGDRMRIFGWSFAKCII
ncbi:hypothetical protein CPC08DRAFT_746024 [Agrocybe pediades]|nr:hypothetical protein CPC08DRAFT_746024 [Agrocybe pediades]